MSADTAPRPRSRPSRRASVACAAVAAFSIAACQAAPAPATGAPPTGAGPSGLPTQPAAATDDASQPTDPAAEVPILADDAFHRTSEATCREAQPGDVYALEGPELPTMKVPGYTGLSIVVLEMRGQDGSIGPPPPLPPGQAYYPASDSPVVIEGATEALPAEAAFASQVDLLACVALRTGESASYSGPDGELTIFALEAIVWMVDRAAGTRLGEPWVAGGDLSMLINVDNLLRVEGSWLLPTDVRTGIAYFMAESGPLGGAYQGGADGYVVAEFDAPPDIPTGTRLLPGYAFVVRLVVLGTGTGSIDFIDLLCAPSGTVAGTPLRVSEGVPHDLGRFAAESIDVRIEGDFIESTLATGTIDAVSQRARDCGVPMTSGWMAALAMSARAEGDGYALYLP